MQLFTSFEPNTFSTSLSLNWVVLMFCMLALPEHKFLIVEVNYKVKYNFMKPVAIELASILRSKLNPLGSFWPLWTFILMIGFINVSGLLPYVFPASSHLLFTISIAFPLWVGYTCSSWIMIPNHTFAHLVPLNTPKALLPFMVLVELISSLIRPITLAVRLAANIVAGHLLLVLLSSVISLKSPLFILVATLSLICIVVLSILESAVSMIQAYVFVALQSLYISEISQPLSLKL